MNLVGTQESSGPAVTCCPLARDHWPQPGPGQWVKELQLTRGKMKAKAASCAHQLCLLATLPHIVCSGLWLQVLQDGCGQGWRLDGGACVAKRCSPSLEPASALGHLVLLRKQPPGQSEEAGKDSPLPCLRAAVVDGGGIAPPPRTPPLPAVGNGTRKGVRSPWRCSPLSTWRHWGSPGPGSGPPAGGKGAGGGVGVRAVAAGAPEALAPAWAQSGVGPPQTVTAPDLALVRVPDCLKIPPQPLPPTA